MSGGGEEGRGGDGGRQKEGHVQGVYGLGGGFLHPLPLQTPLSPLAFTSASSSSTSLHNSIPNSMTSPPSFSENRIADFFATRRRLHILVQICPQNMKLAISFLGSGLWGKRKIRNNVMPCYTVYSSKFHKIQTYWLCSLSGTGYRVHANNITNSRWLPSSSLSKKPQNRTPDHHVCMVPSKNYNQII